MQILVSLSNIRAGLGVYTNVGFAKHTEKKPEYSVLSFLGGKLAAQRRKLIKKQKEVVQRRVSSVIQLLSLPYLEIATFCVHYIGSINPTRCES